MQKITECFRENLDKYINNNSLKARSDVLEALNVFISIDTDSLKPTDEDKEEDLKQAVIAVKVLKEVIEN